MMLTMKKLKHIPVLLTCCIGIVFAEDDINKKSEKKEIANKETVNINQDMLEMKTRSNQILQLLVEQGILTKEQALDLIKKAEKIAKEKYLTPTEMVDKALKDETSKIDIQSQDVVRVPYIPEYIRNKIRDEVRFGLKEDVTRDVLSEAKTKQWGVPGSWPIWLKYIKPYGDIRLRAQIDTFDSDNLLGTLNFQAINEAGGIDSAGIDAFFNTTEDRQRLRYRFRFGVKAKITEYTTVDARFATGNSRDPVSTNQTLGSYNTASSLNLDRAYLSFTNQVSSWKMHAGRIPNPWLSTDLIWDKDVNFDGVAATYFWRRTDNIYDEEERQFDPYLTFGVFPLEEIELNSEDKWLYGFQIGFDYLFENQNKLKMALAYYSFDNITGRRNTPNSNLLDFTAPDFLQKGNTVVDISGDSSSTTNNLFALASDFDEVALTLSYDIVRFVPTHIILDVEYVKNIGFDQNEILQNLGVLIDEENEGYQVKLTVGWPKVRKKNDWQVSVAYKNLEGDAVLDAFTDSDFHLGGTNTKGFVLAGKYGLTFNTWLQLRIFNTDEISDAPFGITTTQLDLNARF